MRQLRVRSEPCHVPSSLQQYFKDCQNDYSSGNEEQRSFEPGWANATSQVSNASIQRAFQYQSGGYVYDFRGRLTDLQGNVSQLRQMNWIDSQTRAVLIQFTLYNPNVQLFTSVNLLAEFLPMGCIRTQSNIDPLPLLVLTSTSQLIWGILYLTFIVYMMAVEAKSMMKLKGDYVRQFWSFVHIGIIVCAWTSVGIFIWRYREVNRAGALFTQTNGYASVNLQVAIYANDLLTYLLAFSCFFATLKFIRLGRYNHRLMFFVRTLQTAAADLLSFVSMFSIIFVAFIGLFHLLFVGELRSCASFLHTAQMLFEMTLMKFDAQQLSEAAPLLGPFSFSLFILTVVFVCMSMLVAIVNRSFRRVRRQGKVQAHQDQPILSFMLEKFRRAIGAAGSDESSRHEEYDQLMRSKYVDPVRNFPDKIDQLFSALDRVTFVSLNDALTNLSSSDIRRSARSSKANTTATVIDYLAFCFFECVVVNVVCSHAFPTNNQANHVHGNKSSREANPQY